MKKGNAGKVVLWIVIVLVIVGAFFVFSKGFRKSRKNGLKTVQVTRGNIVEKALAIGSIVPRNEISVKSKVSGVVKRIFAEPGDRVTKGDPLIEIMPDPTPLEVAEARRQVELDRIAFEEVSKNLERDSKLLKRGLVSEREYESTKRTYDESALRLKMSEERLQLIEQGRVEVEGRQIESIVRSPIEGFVLEKNVNVGDPVVPLTSYQAGTVLMTIADMDSLIFRGTVDEIDVGKLHVGMKARITVGALPNVKLEGMLERISLKAKEDNNARVFPVEISIEKREDIPLRAGYSANAEIVVNEAINVLTLPERVVYFSGDSTYVEVPGSDGNRRRVTIETGLSDAIMIEVKKGLKEGDEVCEKPEKEL